MQIITIVRKPGILLLFAFLSLTVYSQTTLNSYKYVILPQKFDFLSSQDEYGLNSAAKTLLEQKGFTVYLTNGNIPQAISANRCSALTADVTQRKALFTTNLTLYLKDCYGNTIFKGKEGRSWEKDFGTAYNEALKNAFTTLNATPYKYDSTQSVAAAAVPTAPATTAPVAAPVTASSQQPATVPPAPVTTPPAPSPAPQNPTVVPAAGAATGTLYAQPITNGYQLIDATPKKILTLQKTSLPDCFLAQTPEGSANGIVYKNNDQWFFEYYKDGTLVSQKLTIKF